MTISLLMPLCPEPRGLVHMAYVSVSPSTLSEATAEGLYPGSATVDCILGGHVDRPTGETGNPEKNSAPAFKCLWGVRESPDVGPGHAPVLRPCWEPCPGSVPVQCRSSVSRPVSIFILGSLLRALV